ncbi:archease [Candidatus Woesearchaeota archaeon]|nr:archease [Candidatus Woesearchaeota archaeon]
MVKFKILEHTADGKFRAFGKSRERQFGNAVLAMFSYMFDIKKINPKIKKQVKVSAKDEKALLYRWLEEFLVLLDTAQFIPCKIDKIKITKKSNKWEIIGSMLGNKVGKHKHIGSVKAVTYAEMEIKKDFVQVVVDL